MDPDLLTAQGPLSASLGPSSWKCSQDVSWSGLLRVGTSTSIPACLSPLPSPASSSQFVRISTVRILFPRPLCCSVQRRLSALLFLVLQRNFNIAESHCLLKPCSPCTPPAFRAHCLLLLVKLFLYLSLIHSFIRCSWRTTVYQAPCEPAGVASVFRDCK